MSSWLILSILWPVCSKWLRNNQPPNPKIHNNTSNSFLLVHQNIVLMIADFIFFVEDLIYEHVTFQKLLWFNWKIKVDNRPIFFKYFSEKGVNLVSHIIKENGEIKSWDEWKNEFKLEQRLYFKWFQLVNTISSNWKNSLKHSDSNSQNLMVLGHYLVKPNYIVLKSSSRTLLNYKFFT